MTTIANRLTGRFRRTLLAMAAAALTAVVVPPFDAADAAPCAPNMCTTPPLSPTPQPSAPDLIISQWGFDRGQGTGYLVIKNIGTASAPTGHLKFYSPLDPDIPAGSYQITGNWGPGKDGPIEPGGQLVVPSYYARPHVCGTWFRIYSEIRELSTANNTVTGSC